MSEEGLGFILIKPDKVQQEALKRQKTSQSLKFIDWWIQKSANNPISVFTDVGNSNNHPKAVSAKHIIATPDGLLLEQTRIGFQLENHTLHYLLKSDHAEASGSISVSPELYNRFIAHNGRLTIQTNIFPDIAEELDMPLNSPILIAGENFKEVLIERSYLMVHIPEYLEEEITSGPGRFDHLSLEELCNERGWDSQAVRKRFGKKMLDVHPYITFPNKETNNGYRVDEFSKVTGIHFTTTYQLLKERWIEYTPESKQKGKGKVISIDSALAFSKLIELLTIEKKKATSTYELYHTYHPDKNPDSESFTLYQELANIFDGEARFGIEKTTLCDYLARPETDLGIYEGFEFFEIESVAEQIVFVTLDEAIQLSNIEPDVINSAIELNQLRNMPYSNIVESALIDRVKDLDALEPDKVYLTAHSFMKYMLSYFRERGDYGIPADTP
ncbi:MAG: hypothetical protein ABIE22_03940 [archaeon]